MRAFWVINMKIKIGCLYIISDRFFQEVNDPCLMENKTASRPHFFAVHDEKTDLIWLVPLSSKVEKYRSIIDRRTAAGKKTRTIHIVKINGRESALLLQNMLPVASTYIERPYIIKGRTVGISNKKLLSDIERDARWTKIMIEKGFKFIETQPNVRNIEQLMLEKKAEIESKGRRKVDYIEYFNTLRDKYNYAFNDLSMTDSQSWLGLEGHLDRTLRPDEYVAIKLDLDRKGMKNQIWEQSPDYYNGVLYKYNKQLKALQDPKRHPELKGKEIKELEKMANGYISDKYPKKEKVSVREKLVEAYVKSLESGELPWNSGWKNGNAARTARAFNPVTKTRYKGINRAVLTLSAQVRGFTDPRWVTFKQAQKKGWKIMKGAKSEQLEFWLMAKKGERKTLTMEEFREKCRDPEFDSKEWVPRARYYNVFNAQEVLGIPPLELQIVSSIKGSEAVDRIAKSMGVQITHGGDRAFYNPVRDIIRLPEKSQFVSEYSYDATKLHECCHATGHHSRLKRDLTGGFGSEKYAKEELRAEIGSSFLMADLGMMPSPDQIENHAAYVQSWITVLKNEPEVLFDAIRDAEKIDAYALEISGIGKDLDKAMDHAVEAEIEPVKAYGIRPNGNQVIIEDKASRLENTASNFMMADVDLLDKVDIPELDALGVDAYVNLDVRTNDHNTLEDQMGKSIISFSGPVLFVAKELEKGLTNDQISKIPKLIKLTSNHDQFNKLEKFGPVIRDKNGEKAPLLKKQLSTPKRNVDKGLAR